MAAEQVPPGVDITRPSPARLYDYYLGGTNNFAVDRAAAEKMRELVPELFEMAWANRGFHQRAARWIAERGVRQFIDVGSGLPTTGNTHEVVKQVFPEARVVYADIDPMVAAQSATLITDPSTTRLIQADLRAPEAVLGHPELRELIDFTQPVGLLMTAVLHFVSDASDPRGLVARYLAALAPGSYLAISHITKDRIPPQVTVAGNEAYDQATEQIHARTRPEVAAFFDGLELTEPYPGAGPVICYVGMWGAEDPAAADTDEGRVFYCGVGRRP
jgi:trans-aconitate methyltransferase